LRDRQWNRGPRPDGDARGQAQLAADWDHATGESSRREPPAELPGDRVIGLAITGGSPAAGARLPC
jgi:hypothetical protein